MDQAAQRVSSPDLVRVNRRRVLPAVKRRRQLERGMGSMAVVMRGVGAKHTVEVPATEHEHPVQALGPDLADPPLGVRIRVRRSDRGEE